MTLAKLHNRDDDNLVAQETWYITRVAQYTWYSTQVAQKARQYSVYTTNMTILELHNRRGTIYHLLHSSNAFLTQNYFFILQLTCYFVSQGKKPGPRGADRLGELGKHPSTVRGGFETNSMEAGIHSASPDIWKIM